MYAHGIAFTVNRWANLALHCCQCSMHIILCLRWASILSALTRNYAIYCFVDSNIHDCILFWVETCEYIHKIGPHRIGIETKTICTWNFEWIYLFSHVEILSVQHNVISFSFHMKFNRHLACKIDEWITLDLRIFLGTNSEFVIFNRIVSVLETFVHVYSWKLIYSALCATLQ